MKASVIGTRQRRVGVILMAGMLVLSATAPMGAQSPAAASGEPGAAASASPELAARMADLRTKLEGQSISVGSSAFPNPQIINFFKTIEFLRDDYGLVVDARTSDADPLVAALVAGQSNIGELSLALLANANAAGAGLEAVGGNQARNTFGVYAKAPITSLEELRGKPFGGPQNMSSIVGQTAQKCFAQAGMDVTKDVQLIAFNNTGEAQAALINDQVDGAMTFDVRLTPVELTDPSAQFNTLCDGGQVNPQLGSVFAVKGDYAAANPDLMLALAISSVKANRWFQDDPAGWQAMAVSQLQDYTPEMAAMDYQKLKDVDFWPANGSLLRDGCDSTLATSYEFKVIEQPLTCDDIATFQFQDEAVRLLGAR